MASKLTVVEHAVACPPQWLPVILAGTPWPPTHRRRLVDTFFTNTADLRTAAQEYTTNQQTAIVTYGPIADWDVSAITDMKGLFLNLNHFNSDISSWNTSGVTDMTRMFEVRAPSVAPYIAFSRTLPACMLLASLPPNALPPPDPHLDPASYAHILRLGRARMPSTSR